MAITTWKLNRDEQLNWLLELNTKEYKISNKLYLSTLFGHKDGAFVTIETMPYTAEEFDQIEFFENEEDNVNTLILPDKTSITLWPEDTVQVVKRAEYCKLRVLIPIIDIKELFAIGSTIKNLRL
jgi:hypothetical protein